VWNRFSEKLTCADIVPTAATVPQIMQGLKKVTCSQGKAARFEAVIHGQPTPEITWFDYSTLHIFAFRLH